MVPLAGMRQSHAINTADRVGLRERLPTRKKRQTLPRSRSSSRRKQQTLTQMDFVSFTTPDLSEFDLEYIQENESHGASAKTKTPSVPERPGMEFQMAKTYSQHVKKEDSTHKDACFARPLKRQCRKSAQPSEAPLVYSRVQTRSSTKRKLRANELSHEMGSTFAPPAPTLPASTLIAFGTDERGVAVSRTIDTDQPESELAHLGDSSLSISLQASSASNPGIRQDAQSSKKIQMLPPCTPRKQKLEEVPSSQSPPATPWSITSRASCKSAIQSPLQQKSANAAKLSRLSSLRRKALPYPTLEIQDTLDDDKENHGVSSILATPVRQPRRSATQSARQPLQRTTLVSGTNREAMAELARITSAATSSTAEPKSRSEIGAEVEDSDGGEGLEGELGSKRYKLQAEAERQTSFERVLYPPDDMDIEEALLVTLAPPSETMTNSGALSKTGTSGLDYRDQALGQDAVSPDPTPSSNRSNLSNVVSNPTTPNRTVCNFESDEVTAQPFLDRSKFPRSSLSNSMAQADLEPIAGPQGSPSPIRLLRETTVLTSSSSMQRGLDTNLLNNGTQKGVDLGLLAGWMRPTESQRLADSLLRDSLDIENAWDLDTEVATQHSP